MEEVALVAFMDNIDVEFKHKLSLLIKIIYVHHHYMESSKPNSEAKYLFKCYVANEIQF